MFLERSSDSLTMMNIPTKDQGVEPKKGLIKGLTSRELKFYLSFPRLAGLVQQQHNC